MSEEEHRKSMRAPYGTWASPITSEVLTQDAVRLGETALDGDTVYWVEQRPSDAGRSVLCCISQLGVIETLTPAPFSVRSRVHEYGGAPFTVRDGTLYFVDNTSQQIHVQRRGEAPFALTANSERRYADLTIDGKRHRLLAVAEQHHADREPENFLVAIDLEAPFSEVTIARGHDFYSSPRVSPDGVSLVYCAWDHPNMPWESCVITLARIDEDGTLTDAKVIAGGADESAIEPRFSRLGDLWFTSDRTGFWNLYRYQGNQAHIVLEDAAEYGRAPWSFGGANFDILATGQAIAIRDSEGQSSLVMIDPITAAVTRLPVPYSDMGQLRLTDHCAIFIGASPLDAPALIKLDLVTGHLAVLHTSSAASLAPEMISAPESISYPTSDGATSHALYYAPRNANYRGEEGELPPLIVMSHGGPTSATRASLNPSIQFWTSRGFAVVDVNYRGSTGYGRAYRRALTGVWGVADVDDCVNAAKYLGKKGLADGARMAIRGGSAGGYTTLCALAFRDVFGAGASYYGIGDLIALTRDTHKFESRYMERLVGPYPASEALYKERSPLFHLEGFSSPLLILQGLEDRVVPAAQSQAVYEALRERGLPVAYIAFEGEQHGFRKATSLRRSIEAELYFYGKVFGFLPAGNLAPVAIDNGATLGIAAMDA